MGCLSPRASGGRLAPRRATLQRVGEANGVRCAGGAARHRRRAILYGERLIYRVLADLVLVIHLAFVLFVALGGLLVMRWRRLAWLHVPAAIWGVLIEYSGWLCLLPT